MIYFVGLPVYVSAASLNCEEWKVTCWDVGKTKTVKVNEAKNGTYKIWYNNQFGVFSKTFPIKWKSSDEEIATVNKNGKITIKGKKTGSALIYAMVTHDGEGFEITRSLGICEVKVVHSYKASQKVREVTIWNAGGTVDVCKCGKEKLHKKKNYVYTEDFVKQEMEHIVQMCPFTVSWFDNDGKLHHENGYQTPEDYFEWLIKKKKYPESILKKDTTATSSGKYRERNRQSSREAGCHVFEVLLSGYQNYECIHTRYGDDGNFDFETDLKAGDIIASPYYYIFKEYQYDEDEVSLVVYDGSDGVFSEKVIYYAPTASVYRLPNYK